MYDIVIVFVSLSLSVEQLESLRWAAETLGFGQRHGDLLMFTILLDDDLCQRGRWVVALLRECIIYCVVAEDTSSVILRCNTQFNNHTAIIVVSSTQRCAKQNQQVRKHAA